VLRLARRFSGRKCLSGTQWAKDVVRPVDGVQTDE